MKYIYVIGQVANGKFNVFLAEDGGAGPITRMAIFPKAFETEGLAATIASELQKARNRGAEEVKREFRKLMGCK